MTLALTHYCLSYRNETKQNKTKQNKTNEQKKNSKKQNTKSKRYFNLKWTKLKLNLLECVTSDIGSVFFKALFSLLA